MPIIITSGYRPPELNRLIGGSPSSQHLTGQAADIRAVGKSPETVFRQLDRMLALPIDQLIFEFRSWVHVSIADEPRRQMLTAVRMDGETKYLPGLHV